MIRATAWLIHREGMICNRQDAFQINKIEKSGIFLMIRHKNHQQPKVIHLKVLNILYKMC